MDRMTTIAEWLKNRGSWWIGTLLSLIFLLGFSFSVRSAAFDHAIDDFEARASPPLEEPVDRTVLDARRGGYDHEEVARWLAAIGPRGRATYAATQLTLDAAFPLALGLLLATLMARGARSSFPTETPAGTVRTRRWALQLLWLPILAVLLDLGENVSTAAMAVADPDSLPTSQVVLTSAVTRGKLFAYLASVAGVLVLSWRSLGSFALRALGARVALLALATLHLLVLLAVHGVPTVANAFITESASQLALSAFMAVIAVVLLGHAFVLSWQLAHARIERDSSDFLLFDPSAPRSSAAEGRWFSIPPGAALAAVLLLPLLCVLAVQSTAPPRWTGFGLVFGVVAGGTMVVTVDRLLPTLRGSWLDRALDRLMKRLGPGFWGDDGAQSPEGDTVQTGHKRSIALTVLLMIVYAVLYSVFDPDYAGLSPPTIAFVLVWLTTIALVVAGLAFFLDRWRIPVLLVLLAYSVGLNSISPRAHEFEVFPLAGSTLAEDEGRRTRTRPEIQTVELERSAASERILTIVAADGGGIQAAAWTTQVLTGLQDRFGDRFTDSVELLSGVSGGSVGLFFYLEAAMHQGDRGPSPAARSCVRQAAVTSSLEATAWGLLGPDFWRVALPRAVPPTRDRAWALERAWVHTAARMRRAIDRTVSEGGGGKACAEALRELGDQRTDGAASLLSAWRAGARAGRLPDVIFNATVVDDGSQAFFTTVDPADLGCREDEACHALTRFDLRTATAARLSATFPYVTPVARPHLDDLPKDLHDAVGHWSLGDGGYFDNYGSFAAVQWLRAHDERVRRADRVVVLQIRSFPTVATADAPTGDEGLALAIAGPLKALFEVRTASQFTRSQVELELLEQILERQDGPAVQRVEIRPPSLLHHEAPLSWSLSKQNVRAIERQWTETLESGAVACLARIYDGPVTDEDDDPCASEPALPERRLESARPPTDGSQSAALRTG